MCRKTLAAVKKVARRMKCYQSALWCQCSLLRFSALWQQRKPCLSFLKNFPAHPITQGSPKTLRSIRLNGQRLSFIAPIQFRRLFLRARLLGHIFAGFLVADLNRDGIPDLLLHLNPPGRDSVVLGRGDATFADPIPGPYTFNLAGVADFNADGIQDVLTLGFYASAPQIYCGCGMVHSKLRSESILCAAGAR